MFIELKGVTMKKLRAICFLVLLVLASVTACDRKNPGDNDSLAVGDDGDAVLSVEADMQVTGDSDSSLKENEPTEKSDQNSTGDKDVSVSSDTDIADPESDTPASDSSDTVLSETENPVLPDNDTYIPPECTDGAVASQDCANSGKQVRVCSGGKWGDYGDCINITSAIMTLANDSACAKINWKDRGSAPKAYTKGMGLVFAGAVCHKTRPDVVLVSAAKGSDPKKDALLWYDTIFTDLQMSNDVAGPDTLRHAYTLLIGLGMRESSGEHCCGRDTSASNTTAETAEAGLFQTSYNSHTINKELDTLYAYWKNVKANTPAKCLLEVFQQGVTCSSADWENFGTGEGVTFQQLEKECPAFAAEYAAVMLRVSGGSLGHYGPLRTKAAEVKAECDTMFNDIQKLIEKQPAFGEFLTNY